jgi:flagellar protein FliS
MTNPRTAYREAEVRGASPVRLVIMLYEQVIEDLRQAARAMEENDIERRTSRINHALDVVARLQVTLNMEHGGQVAEHLLRFYEESRANLWKAQLSMSKTALLQQIVDLLTLREAWVEVERTESAKALPKAVSPPPAAANAAPEASATSNWKA